MSATSFSVLTIGPNKVAKTYSSVRATSRVLSGNGTDSRRGAIANRCDNGGGFVGEVWVQYTRYPVGA
jgi:hypothetical protein